MNVESIERKKWRNWARTSESQPVKTFFPSTITEVCAIVKAAQEHQKTIRVVGAGHSFTKLVETEDWLVSLDRLNGIDEIDETAKTVTVYAGTRLFELGKALGEHGYSQENLGDINVQSIAGALSTGTHGTGLAFGNLSTQVMKLEIVNAHGDVVTLSRELDPNLFHASLVSLGALGIIVKVTLRIIEAPIYKFKSYKLPYSKLEAQLDELIDSNRHFEFFLFPYSELVQVKTMNLTNDAPQRIRFYYFKNVVLENYLFFLVSELCRLFPKTSKFFSRLSAKGVGSSTISAYSHQLFATPRLVRFREMEYSIPLQHLRDALRDVRKTIETNNYAVHFPIECRTVKADDIWLSPSYKRDSAYLAFHMYKGMPYENYFRDMEKIMRKYNGRPHWGKMHCLSKHELQELYPKFNHFLEIRDSFDPNGRFLNRYMQELFEVKTKHTVSL